MTSWLNGWPRRWTIPKTPMTSSSRRIGTERFVPERNRAVVRVLGICGDVGDVHGLASSAPPGRSPDWRRSRAGAPCRSPIRPSSRRSRPRAGSIPSRTGHMRTLSPRPGSRRSRRSRPAPSGGPRDRAIARSTSPIARCCRAAAGGRRPAARSDRDRRLVGEGLHSCDVSSAEGLGERADDPIAPIRSSSKTIGTPRPTRNVRGPGRRTRGHVDVAGCRTTSRVSRAARPTIVVRSSAVRAPRRSPSGRSPLRETAGSSCLRADGATRIAMAQPRGRFDDLVHHRLKPSPARRADDRAQSPLLLAQVSPRTPCLAQPLAQLRVARESFSTFELGPYLPDRAEALRDHVVVVDRLHVELARVYEVSVGELGIGLERRP